MECNKDDALRAKEIAEKKFTEKDYAGAKRFMLKAQNLYPALEGMSDMLSTLDVYISAENKICGEADWYGILGVNPWDDDETVRKQYRKLALMLHPDKNKSIGADGAFKLVSEAWSLLSDKSKRLAYNQKRNSRVVQQQMSSHTNGFYSNHTNSNVRDQNINSRGNSNSMSIPSHRQQKNNTFWTICNRCKTHYEYLRVYLNHTLLCPNCHEAFYAAEKAPPPHVFKPSNLGSSHMHKRSRGGSSTQVNAASRHSFNYATPPSSAAQGATVLHDSMKKRKIDDFHTSTQTGVGERGYHEVERTHSYYGYNKVQSERDLVLETRSMLIEKARIEIRKKLDDLSSRTEANEAEAKVGHALDSSAPVAINVPDPDFHNFDIDRSENSFEVDQVWAAYADGDGMPRFYARIQKVLSLKPFKVQISWLNSRSTSEFGSLDWIGSGFTKTCGDFRAGRIEISRSLNSFSHRVAWMKGMRGVIRIYPRKGEVWALYKNWSRDWDEGTPKELVHQYDMVEVLDEYEEETGISVAPLVKVTGFKAVFHRHMDLKQVRRVPVEEMFRFSHQVPSHLLTGQEAPNAPNGCLELDPAAMPVDLLQVITEVEDKLRN